ncbi:MAG: YceH family protein [Acidimicrobiia bacterium]|nr:YceH family protein [Acidimicrobiia bacterium]
MQLTPMEIRVLGCLIEKEMTTPDYYPMTINALQAACNQKSNRSPVVDYTEAEVIQAVDGLREHGVARTVHGKGDRSLKYRHVVNDVMGLGPEPAAVLAVLLLRGPQTVGELRTRTGRYVEFANLAEVAEQLRTLQEAETPLIEMLVRRPGEKESRFRHLLGGDESADAASPVQEAPPSDEPDDTARVAELERELVLLRDRVARMERELGLDS